MTVSKAVRRLESAGLVVREGLVTDGRATNVRFTPAGRRVGRKAIVAIESADEAFFSCLTKTELDAYKRLTAAVVTSHGPRGPSIRAAPGITRRGR